MLRGVACYIVGMVALSLGLMTLVEHLALSLMADFSAIPRTEKSRVAMGLDAQKHASAFEPVRYVIEIPPPPALSARALAAALDEAEGGASSLRQIAKRRGPVVAGWLKRVSKTKRVVAEEEPGHIMLRSLRAEM